MKCKRAALLPLVLAAACGGTPPPAQPPSGLTAPPTRPLIEQPAQVAAAAEEPLPPPEAPQNLTAVVRVADPQRTWGDATRLLGATPFGMLLMGMAQMGPDMLAEEALGPALANVVDLEQPLDVAVLDTSGDSFVVSLAVREREVPRLHERFVLKEERGLLRVDGVRGAEPEAKKLPMSCAIDPGDRRGSARVVCAPQRDGLEAARYLVQVIAREPIDTDIRLELRAPALAKLLEEENVGLEGGDDDSVSRMGRALGQGFLRDLEGLTLDQRWVGQDIELGLGLRFSGRRSPLTLALVPDAKAAAPPPPSFFRMPRDAGFAFYTRGASRDELAPLRGLLFDALLADSVEDGYDRAKMKPFLDRLAGLILTGGPLVISTGLDRPAAEKALAAYDEKKTAPKVRESARRAIGGWVLIGLEEQPGPWIDGLRELVKLNGEIDKGKRKPAPGSAAAKRDEERKEDTTWVLGRAPASLPSGTLHIELRTKPLKKDAPPAHTGHFYAVPDGGRLWLGSGEDDAAVIARLKAALDPAQGAQTLGAAPEIAPLRQPGSTTGGFLSIYGAAALIASGDTPEALDEASRRIGGLGTLPARGTTPILWTIGSEVLPSGAARWGLRFRMPSAAIQDLITLVTR